MIRELYAALLQGSDASPVEGLAAARSIGQLLAALRDGEIELDAESLADALWLARARRGAPRQAGTASTEPRRTPRRPTEPRPPDATPRDPTRATSPRTGRSRPAAVAEPARGTGARPGVEVALRRVEALPGKLELGRSLRPLKQRHPSKRSVVLDAEATVDHFCDSGILNPVFRPGAERWFDVDVLVDTSPSMEVWQDMGLELAQLLQRHGAFREVRHWSLRRHDGKILLASDTGLRYEPLQLVDPDARRITMVVTDAIGPMWYRPAVWDAIRRWGLFSPVVLVSTLPPRLWPQTALGAAGVRMTALRPGAANRALQVRLPWWWPDEHPPDDPVPVPVITLEPGPVAAWARMVMGAGGIQTEGVFAVEPATPQAAPAPPRSVEERLQQFRTTVSDEAVRLATYLAAAVRRPWGLPLARVVQRAMLPESRQVHLAEVLVGGLVREVEPVGGERRYEFLPEVGDALRRDLTGSEAVRVLGALAAHVERSTGRRSGIAAVLLGDEAPTDAATEFAGLRKDAAALAADLSLEQSGEIPEPRRPAPPPAPALVYLAYAHEDREWADLVSRFLRPALRDSGLELWSDQAIEPGSRWGEQIQRAIDRSRVAVVLVTTDLLNSEFIVENELPALLRRAEARDLTLLPVLVENTAFQSTVLAEYEFALDANTPLSTMREAQRDKALAELARKVAELLEPDVDAALRDSHSAAGPDERDARIDGAVEAPLRPVLDELGYHLEEVELKLKGRSLLASVVRGAGDEVYVIQVPGTIAADTVEGFPWFMALGSLIPQESRAVVWARDVDAWHTEVAALAGDFQGIEVRLVPWREVLAASQSGAPGAVRALLGLAASHDAAVEAPEGGFLKDEIDLDEVTSEPAVKAVGEDEAVIRTWNRFGGLLTAVADELGGVDPHAAAAVWAVETGGTGVTDLGPVIRFENQLFYERWGQHNQSRFDDHFQFDPDRRWAGHKFREGNGPFRECHHEGQKGEYEVFRFAAGLDSRAAHLSISMGAPQILGIQHRGLGYATPEEMFAAYGDEGAQVLGFFDFIRGWSSGRALAALRSQDWRQLSRAYNGTDEYGEKLKSAFTRLRAALAKAGPADKQQALAPEPEKAADRIARNVPWLTSQLEERGFRASKPNSEALYSEDDPDYRFRILKTVARLEAYRGRDGGRPWQLVRSFPLADRDALREAMLQAEQVQRRQRKR